MAGAVGPIDLGEEPICREWRTASQNPLLDVLFVSLSRPPDSATAFRYHDITMRCHVTGPTQARQRAVNLQPGWLLLGSDLDETSIQRLIRGACLPVPGMRVAMLGASRDIIRCNRWIRRGVGAYLSAERSLDETLAVLVEAAEFHVVVIDQCFVELAASQDADMRRRLMLDEIVLTRREKDVLKRIRLGMRNCEIGEALTLSDSTIEFHVTHILSKLGVLNRTAAAEVSRMMDT